MLRTSLVVRDLAFGLKQLGHLPMIYSPELGGVSKEIIDAGILIVTDLAVLPKVPDILKEIKKYSAMDANKVTDQIRAEASLTIALKKYVTLYKTVIGNWQNTKEIELHSAIKPYLQYLL